MIYETTTAADGSFRFDAVDPGIYVLSYWAVQSRI
jgi:hypothetical protein